MTGADVTKRREELGITKAQLARLLGVIPTTVQNYEIPTRVMRINTERVIRQVFDRIEQEQQRAKSA